MLRTLVHVGDVPAGLVARHAGRCRSAIPTTGCCARGPRFRLEAEMVRDVALAVSGLLSREDRRAERVPAAAAGVWDNAATTTRQWIESTRRGPVPPRPLHVPGGAPRPYPTFMTFDAPSREVCTRAPRAHEHAAAGAGHAERPGVRRGARGRWRGACGAEAGPTVDARCRTASAWSRADCRRRRAGSSALLDAQRAGALRGRAGEAAEALGRRTTPSVTADEIDLAAWTVVGNVLLNLDETRDEGVMEACDCPADVKQR